MPHERRSKPFTLDTRSLSDKAYEYLASRIIEGAIEYGETLRIREIAEILGVSVMPVREALKRLDMEGIVRINPRSGCSVTVPTKKSVLDTFEMRQLIEMYCVEKIYPGVKEADLKGLAAVISRMGAVIRAGGRNATKEYIKLDRLYHSEICRLADNDFLSKFYREINLHLNMTYIYGISAPPDLTATYTDHAEIHGYLLENSAQAKKVLKRHLQTSMDNMRNGRLFKSLG